MIGNEYEQNKLLELVSAADFVVAHNAKFELGWLFRCGVSAYNVLPYCTQVAEYVWAGNRQYPLSLDASLARHGLGSKLKLVSILIGSGICPSEIPIELLTKYNLQDVEQTHLLFLQQRAKYTTLLPVISTRCFVIPMLASLESVGLQLTDEVVSLNSGVIERYLQLEQEFSELTGNINWNSPKQISEYLYDTLKFTEPINPRSGDPDRTAAGGRKTDKITIESLKATTQEQKQFKKLKLELGAVESDSRILSKLDSCYKNNNGLLYFNYNNTIVKTGRLSSTGGQYKIQGQNIARKLKRLFGPRYEKYSIGEIDYPNLEWRVAGHYGRDKQLRADVLSGFDVHRFSADVFGISRQAAKAETFRPLFGSKGQTPQQKKYAIEFRKRWNGVDHIQRQWAQSCLLSGRVVSETGWTFYWPAKLTKSGYIEYTTQIYDYPIQYLAGGEITPIAALYLWYLTADMDSFMNNTVHDSVIYEVAEHEKDEWKQLGIECYTSRVYNYLEKMYNIDFYIPLGADFKIGPLWSVGEEDKIDVTREGEILRIRK